MESGRRGREGGRGKERPQNNNIMYTTKLSLTPLADKACPISLYTLRICLKPVISGKEGEGKRYTPRILSFPSPPIITLNKGMGRA